MPFGIGSTLSGTDGTGGGSSAGLCEAGRRGDADLRDLSDMEPALGDLFSPRALSRLPIEEADALRRMVRFVWTSATLVGV